MGMTIDEFRKLNSSSMTRGALNAGSGFNTAHDPNETANQYTDRLEAWKKSKGLPLDVSSPAKAPAPAVAPQASSAAASVEAPMAGLTAIDPGTSQTQASGMAMGGAGGTMLEPGPDPMTGVASGALGQLRNLGRRTPPMDTYALAGLKKIY